jgi:outer membrane biosynthesis protein TonB
MRAATAYFVGAGTIITAITIGLGGGIVAGNIMNPIAPKQGANTAELARRAGPTEATTNAASERIEYLTGSQAFGAMTAAPAQAQEDAKPSAKSLAKPGVKSDEAQTTQPSAAPSSQQNVAAEEPKRAAAQQPAKPAEQQAATEPSSSSTSEKSAPENANAKARDSDVKRAAAERHRAQRRERWAERRHYDGRDYSRRTDWNDVARNIREDSDARDVVARPRSGFPQFRLFGPDDGD